MIRNKSIEWMLLIAIILFFYPYLSLGFTTNDDAFNQVYHLWDDFKTNAFVQGRVHFMLAHWLIIKISFLVKEIFFIKAIMTLSVISNIIYFGYLIEKITHQRNFSYIFIIVFITFLQDSWDHFLLTSSPLIYTVGFSLFLISLQLYIFHSTHKLKLILSAFLFIISVQISEMFFLFCLFYILFPYSSTLKDRLFKLRYHLIFSTLYICIYLGFRGFFGSDYEGNHVNEFSFVNFIKTLSIYSLSTTPVTSFLSHTSIGLININQFLNYPFDFRVSASVFGKIVYMTNNILSNLGDLNVIWIVKYLFFIAIVSESLKSIKEINKRMINLMFIFAVLLIFIPNILHSLTGKYQDWALLYNAKGYVGTYFSYFGMVLLLISLGLFLINLGWFNKNNSLGRVRIYSILLITFFVSIITSISNETIFNQKKQSHYRWEIMDKLFINEAFKSIKDGDNIYTLGLTNNIGIVNQYGSENSVPDYWDRYVLMKTGKKVKFSDKIPKSIEGNNHYILKLIQHKTHYDIFAIFAKMTTTTTLINDFYLLSVANGGNVLTYETKTSFKSFPFKLKEKRDFKFIQETDVNIESIWVNYPIRNRRETLSFVKPMEKGNIYTGRVDYQFSEGFYNKEQAGIDFWNWGEKKASLIINNHADQNVSVNLSFLVSTQQEKSIQINVTLKNKKQVIIQAPKNDTKIVLSFNLSPGQNKIDFTPERSAKPLAAVSARNLYFKIKNLVISEIN